MTENRLADYLDHMHRAARDACGFVEGIGKDAFAADRRTQQAVIMSLVIIGEAATKIMDHHPAFTDAHPKYPGAASVACAIASRMAISTSISTSCGKPCRHRCRRC